MLELPEEEPQILLELIQIERLVGHDGVDAEAAGVRASQAGDHRDALEQRGFAQVRLDVAPALADGPDLRRLPRRGELQALRPVG